MTAPPDWEMSPNPAALKQPTKDQTADRVTRSRIWLDTHQPRPTIPLTPHRSPSELAERKTELETIFAAAPDDQRDLINRLRNGDLTSTETIRMLETALNTQDHRRDWILTNWPHVIEHADITRTLKAGAAGGEVDVHLETLTSQDGPLGHAATTGEPWLKTSLSHLTPPDAEHLDDDTIDLLTAIANYRQHWNITHPEPLGQAAQTNQQATERARLTRWTEETHQTIQAHQQLHQNEQLTLDYEPEILGL